MLGTIIAISGAMISSFYEGKVLEFGLHKAQTTKSNFPRDKLDRSHVHKRHEYLGILAAVGSCISSAASIVIEVYITSYVLNTLLRMINNNIS